MKTPVIDFHTHGGRWGRMGATDDIAHMLDNMDAAGVDRACINCIIHSDARRGNDIVARAVEQHPNRFIGVGFVTPHYPDEALRELERAFDLLGMRFLKIYPDYFGRPQDDPAYAPILEWANDRGLVIMSHAYYPLLGEGPAAAPGRYETLTARYPRVTWVMAHQGDGGSPEVTEAARRLPNIYLETAGSGCVNGGVQRVVASVGPDRVLYGSDYLLFDMRAQIGKIVTADIPEEAKRKILGLNAARLLGLEVPSGRGADGWAHRR